jgi:hypothetical protein
MKITVALNGTDKNPFEQYGVTQNPFPQIAEYEYAPACLRLQKLGGLPIPQNNAEQYIRETLKGFSEEFHPGMKKINELLRKRDSGQKLTEEEIKQALEPWAEKTGD